MQTKMMFQLGAAALAAFLITGCDKANGESQPSKAAVSKAAVSKTAVSKAAVSKAAVSKAAVSKAAVSKAAATRAIAGAKTERGFVIHSRKSAPAVTREIFDFYKKTYKFMPNLAAIMAESPALLTSYYQLQNNLQKLGSLSPPEDNIVQMAIAMAHKCQYCVAGHTMAGKVFFKSPDSQLQAIRANASLPEAKFNALRNFALQVADSKGRVTDTQLKTFFGAGYTRKQALDVVANIAAKVMTNFTNQLARTPIDTPMKPFAAGLPFAEDRKTIVN